MLALSVLTRHRAREIRGGMSETTLEAARAALGARRNARGYREFSAEGRGAAVAYAKARTGAGATIEEVLAELGLNDWTLKRWLQRSRRQHGRPRKVSKRFTQLSVVSIAPATPGPVLLGPCGLRIEGLGIDEVARLMKKLTCLV
jgi:hypothetical protein